VSLHHVFHLIHLFNINQIITRIIQFNSAFDSEVKDWSDKYDLLEDKNGTISALNQQLIAEKDDLLTKLEKLESNLTNLDDKLNHVITENNHKIENYVDQIEKIQIENVQEKITKYFVIIC